MKKLLLLLILIISQSAYSQITFTDKENNIHLAGPLELVTLETDTNYNRWYYQNYEAYNPQIDNKDWVQNLQDVNVEISCIALMS